MEKETVNKVRAILVREGKIAVSQSKESRAFMLPGGKIENGESKEETLAREILEETGIEIDSKDMKGPFFQTKTERLVKDEQGKDVSKITKTMFYIVDTTQDFNFEKMNLTPREMARDTRMYWVNPAKLEYHLTVQRDNFKSSYASRYAKEYLKVYNKFKEFQKQSEKENLSR